MEKEDIDRLLEAVTKNLNNVLGDSANIKCIKADNDFMPQLLDTYMSYPIIMIYASRDGCDISVDKCSTEDVVNVLPNIIGNLLGLVPEENRNDILCKAISMEMSEDGNLIEYLDGNDE